MDTTIFERIKTGDGREKRAWVEALYTDLTAMLSGKGNGNPFFESAFNSLSKEEQSLYLTKAVESVRSVETNFRIYAMNGNLRTDKLAKLVQQYTTTSEQMSEINRLGFNSVFEVKGDQPYTGHADKVMLVWHRNQNIPAEQYRKAHFNGRSVDLVVCEDPNIQLTQLGKERALIYRFS